jgi:radical SAM protein with 4Fe4S-binding SPASM domain
MNSLGRDIFYVQWHITDACNLRCRHCYQNTYSNKNDLSLIELKSIAGEILSTFSEWGKKGDISITGGEPFLRKDLLEFLSYLDESPDTNYLDILTNGTLIEENTLKKIKRIKKFKYIQISLDGSTPKIHDKIRGHGSHEKAINAIKRLVRNGIEVRVMYTLQKSNLSDVPKMIDLAIKEMISGITFERIVPNLSDDRQKEIALTQNDVKYIYQYISKRSDIEFSNNNPLKILKFRPLWVLIDPCRSNDGSNLKTELGALCSIGLDGICILPNADVLACRRLPVVIGNLRTDSLKKIWTTSKLLWEIADKRNLKGKCKNCEYIPRCSGCRAMAFAYTGDYLAEDPHCWN